ncbi:MAG: acetolactate decarboxylase [Phycisphaerales bacterium JB039]
MTSPLRSVARYAALAAALCSLGCAERARQSGPTPTTTSVQQFGAMRAVMREGSTEARVALREWAGPNDVAVGAIEQLDGEITIVDGGAWVSRVRDGDVLTSGPAVEPDAKATLLTASRVGAWHSNRLHETLAGAELEAAIVRAAAERGIDTSQPFPFIIRGTATSLHMHVINGFCPHSSGEAAAGREPRRIALTEPTPVTIVGFYASDAQGLLTHHGTAMHAHALVDGDGGRVTGHVDSVEIQAGATLRLPDAPPP